MDTATIVGIVIACVAAALIIFLVWAWWYDRNHQDSEFADADGDTRFTRLSKRAKRSFKGIGGGVQHAGEKTQELYSSIKKAVHNRWGGKNTAQNGDTPGTSAKASTFSIEDLHYI